MSIGAAFGLSSLQSLGYTWPSYYPMPPWSAFVVLLFTIVLIVPSINGTVRAFSEASSRTLEEIETRRVAEETARKSEAKYRFLTEHGTDLIWTLDLNLRTTFVTPSVEKVLGFTPEERMLQKVADQLTP